KAMAKQREDARQAWKGSGEARTDTIWFDIRERVGGTEFLGYDTEKAEGVIKTIVAEGKEVAELKSGAKGTLVLNQTPFYGESGGQTGDHGVIRSPEGALFRVTDTQKRVGDLIIHQGILEKDMLKVGDALALALDRVRRSGNRQHHSATHLLHEALRETL